MNAIPLKFPILASGFTLGLLLSSSEIKANPPEGAYVPGEVRLAGLSRVEAGQSIKVDVWAIRPERPYHYSGAMELTASEIALKLELRDATGQWVGGGEPLFRHGQWQSVTLTAGGLKTGRYEVVLTLLYDNLPFNQARKRITVLSAKELEATPGMSAEQIGSAGKLETKNLDGNVTAAILTKGRELSLVLPGEGEVVVYGTFAGATPGFVSEVAGEAVGGDFYFR